MLQHQDLIHGFQPDQAMRDKQKRVTVRQGKELIQNAALGQRVEVGSGFIQQEDGASCNKSRAIARRCVPPRSGAGRVRRRPSRSLWQPKDKVVDLRTPGSLLNLCRAGEGRASNRFFRRVSFEEPGALGEDSDLAADLLLGPGMQVATCQSDLALGVIPEAQYQVAGWISRLRSGRRWLCADRGQAEINSLQGSIPAARISKVHL